MLIIKVNNEKGGIEAALKKLKNKVRSVKQVQQLRERKEHKKPSVVKRLQKQKAVYVQKTKDNLKD